MGVGGSPSETTHSSATLRTELSSTMDVFYPTPSSAAATGHTGLLGARNAASVTEDLPLHFVSFYFKRPPWWTEKDGPGSTCVQTGEPQDRTPATTSVRCPRKAYGTDNCYVWTVPQGTESPWRWVDSTIPPAPPSRAHAYLFRPLADVSVSQLHGDDLHVWLEGLPRAAPDDGGKDQEAGGGGRLPQRRQDQLQKHLRADEGPDQLCGSRALRADGAGLRLPPLPAPRCSASAVPTFTCQKQPRRPVSSQHVLKRPRKSVSPLMSSELPGEGVMPFGGGRAVSASSLGPGCLSWTQGGGSARLSAQ